MLIAKDVEIWFEGLPQIVKVKYHRDNATEPPLWMVGSFISNTTRIINEHAEPRHGFISSLLAHGVNVANRVPLVCYPQLGCPNSTGLLHISTKFWEQRMNHKRKRARSARASRKLSKPWKVNGSRTEREGGGKFGDHLQREAARAAVKAAPLGN